MESSSQTTAQPAYPVQFSVEYPDRALMALLKERGYLKDSEPEPDLGAVSF